MRKRKHGKSQKKDYLKVIIIVLFTIFFLLFLMQEIGIKIKESKNNLIKTYENIEEIAKIEERKKTEKIQEIGETQEKDTINNVEKETKKDEENKKVINNEIPSEYNGYPVIARLEIEKINLDTFVLKEHNEKTLAMSVTKFYGANPNEVGNFCIAGHNYITKNMFHNLKKIEVGDKLKLTDLKGRRINYEVYKKETVLPTETQCLSQKTNGKTEVTLITCTTNSLKRIVIKAVKEGEEKLING